MAWCTTQHFVEYCIWYILIEAGWHLNASINKAATGSDIGLSFAGLKAIIWANTLFVVHLKGGDKFRGNLNPNKISMK